MKIEAYTVYFEFLAAIFHVSFEENLTGDKEFYYFKERVHSLCQNIFLQIFDTIKTFLSRDYGSKNMMIKCRRISLLLLTSMCYIIRNQVFQSVSANWGLFAPPKPMIEHETILFILALMKTMKSPNIIEATISVYRLFEFKSIKPNLIPTIIDVFTTYVLKNHSVQRKYKTTFFRNKRLLKSVSLLN